MSAHTFIQETLEHLPSLRRVAMRLTRSPADADDLVQSTIERALERRGELRDPARLKGWLLAVQRTVFLNARRGLRPSLEILQGGRSDEAPREPSGNLETELHDRTLGSQMSASLAALSPEWRDALWLREVEELSYEEIAEVQGCPVGTIRSRLSRARQSMFEMLEKERANGSL